MTRADFNARRHEMRCRFCGDPRLRILEDAKPPHEAGLGCASCGRHNGWLSKDENAEKRPNIKPGRRDDVWAKFGDRCVHCGIEAKHLDMLGYARTVQHCPPWKIERSQEVLLLPYCEPCQSDSAVKMRRTETLIARILELAEKVRRDA